MKWMVIGLLTLCAVGNTPLTHTKLNAHAAFKALEKRMPGVRSPLHVTLFLSSLLCALYTCSQGPEKITPAKMLWLQAALQLSLDQLHKPLPSHLLPRLITLFSFLWAGSHAVTALLLKQLSVWYLTHQLPKEKGLIVKLLTGNATTVKEALERCSLDEGYYCCSQARDLIEVKSLTLSDLYRIYIGDPVREALRYLQNNRCMTPLVCASVLGNINQIKAFLEKGADINYQDDSEEQRTALHEAAYCNQIASVKTLLQAGADTELIDYSGHTAITLAACEGNEAIVKLLLQHGAIVPSDAQQEALGLNQNARALLQKYAHLAAERAALIEQELLDQHPELGPDVAGLIRSCETAAVPSRIAST